MHRNINSKHPVKATIKFLPTINLNLSDESCIYSTLLFVEQQAQQLNFLSLSITFDADQPLFIKAFKILKAKDANIVIRLENFHLLMSFLGGTGTVMEGCGLSKSTETICQPNSVADMLEAKAYAREM